MSAILWASYSNETIPIEIQRCCQQGFVFDLLLHLVRNLSFTIFLQRAQVYQYMNFQPIPDHPNTEPIYVQTQTQTVYINL